MLQLEATRSVILCAGKSGSGKTTFALRYLVARKDFVCRFVFDPDGQVSRRLEIPAAETQEELSCAVPDGFVIFNPHRLFTGRMEEAFQYFCDWSFWQASQLPGKKVLLVDEVWKYCTPHSIPQPLANCIQTGRVRGLGMIFATQRANQLNDSIIAEVSEVVAFATAPSRALDRLEEMGLDPREVASLPPGAFVSLQVDTGAEIRGRLW